MLCEEKVILLIILNLIVALGFILMVYLMSFDYNELEKMYKIMDEIKYYIDSLFKRKR